MALFFGLGGLFYGEQSVEEERGELKPQRDLTDQSTALVSVLLVNAIAILSEDRFLARSK